MQIESDVVVVGGGPAGSIAALELARRGIRVVVLEAKRYPRDKVCGDGLVPDSLALLESMGLLERVEAEAHRPRSVRIFSPSGDSVSLAAPLLTLRRERFDALLADEARRAGADYHEGVRVDQPLRDEAGAVIGVSGRDGSNQSVEARAKLTILATGAASQMLAAFGVSTRSQPSGVAMRGYYEIPKLDQNELVISYEKPVMPGYAWIFPMGNGEANVGVGLFLVDGITGENLRELFERFLTDCAHVRELMDGAKALGPVKGAPLRCSLSGAKPVGDGLLLAGETFGTTYSLTGEGIGKAMESGRLAAQAAAAALELGRFDALTLRSYPRAMDGARFPEKFAQYDAAQRWVKHTAVVNLVTRRAAKREKLRHMLEALVREEVAPDEIFSLRGLLRAALM